MGIHLFLSILLFLSTTQSTIDTPTENLGKPLPVLKAMRLDKSMVSLPDICSGKITLIALGYQRKSQYTIEKWFSPFKIKYGQDSRFNYYQIIMLSGLGAKFFSGAIRKGIKKKTPEAEQKHFLISLQKVKEYKKSLNLKDQEHTFVFLIDPGGRILWQNQGEPNPEALESLFFTCNLQLDD